MTMDFTASTFISILTVIGVLALIVSIITEVIKGVTILKKIPLNLQVIVLSLLLTLISYFAYISYSGTAIVWYYIVADVIAGFVVAYVALYGWSKLADLYKKFRNIPSLDITTNTTAMTKSTVSDKTTTSSKENNSTPMITETQVPDSIEAGDKETTSATQIIDPATTDLSTVPPLTTDNNVTKNSVSEATESSTTVASTSDSSVTESSTTVASASDKPIPESSTASVSALDSSISESSTAGDSALDSSNPGSSTTGASASES